MDLLLPPYESPHIVLIEQYQKPDWHLQWLSFALSPFHPIPPKKEPDRWGEGLSSDYLHFALSDFRLHHIQISEPLYSFYYVVP